MTLSNPQAAFDALVGRFRRCLDRGRQGGMTSLVAYRDAGEALRELKALVPHGVFGQVATELCGCSKQWRAYLMKLARDWCDVEAALHWAEESGRPLGAKAYSVNGALALAKEWRRAQDSGPFPAKPRSRASKRRSASHPIRENDQLICKLHAAIAYSMAFEQRFLAARSSGPDRVQQEPNSQDREKLRKVAALWHRGGTAGEAATAVHKLFEIADRLGWDLPILLRECAIESPADWTFDERPRVTP
jgi:hypothetical protein